MAEVIMVRLQACNPARNVRRAWSVEAGPDLFGVWQVRTRFGRIGTDGRLLVRSFVDEGAARKHVAAALRRRRGSVRRIGVSYYDVT
jgi:predicted DNA-binding WGR domain protein